jgi:hypothetical protein
LLRVDTKRQQVYLKLIGRRFPPGSVMDVASIDALDISVRAQIEEIAHRQPETDFSEDLDYWDALIVSCRHNPELMQDILKDVMQGGMQETVSGPQAHQAASALHVQHEAGESPRLPPHDRPVTAEQPPSIDSVTTYQAPVQRRILWQTAAGISAFLLAAAALLSSQFCGMPLSGCSDSGWLRAESNTTNKLTFSHGLGTTPTNVMVMFSPSNTGNPGYVVGPNWSPESTGNPVTIAVNQENASLEIWAGAPLRGTWDATTSSWTRHTSGFFRIQVRR